MRRCPTVRILTLAWLTCLWLPGVARAEDNHFGRPGQWFVAGRSALSLGFVRDTLDEAAATEWYLALDPSAGYFFAGPGYVALDFSASYAAESGASLGSVGIGPAIGMRLPIGGRAHFVPSLGLLYTHQRVANQYNTDLRQLLADPAISTQSNILTVKVGVPFLIELRPGFGITLGPTFRQDVYARNDVTELQKATRVTIDIGLVGWS